jgi:predicted outer membrane repeat protein
MIQGGQLIVEDSRIADNVATEQGGAIYSSGVGTISRSSIEGNSASGKGGAMLLSQSSSMQLNNVDIHGNGASADAAIFNQGTLYMLHATITSNRAGHAIDAIGQGSSGSTTYANSILDGRCTGSTAAITALGKNLRTTSFLGGNCAGTTATTAQLALRRATFGGRFEISGTSSASSVLIDAGASPYCLHDDVRSALRDVRCDVGAFEFGAVVP